MSDTTRLILAIVVVVVVVAVIIGLFASARKRRELENRRFEAGELRVNVEEQAQQQAQKADRLDDSGQRLPDQQPTAAATAAAATGAGATAAGAATAGATAAGATSARGATPAAPSAAPGAAAASAPFVRDDDEPDLADAENPFASPSDPVAGSETAARGGEASGADDRGRLDGVVGTDSSERITDESRDDVSNDDATAASHLTDEDPSAGADVTGTEGMSGPPQTGRTEGLGGSTAVTEPAEGTRNAGGTETDPGPDSSTSSTPDTTRGESSWAGSSATGAAAAAGTGAAAGWAARSDDDDDTDATPAADATAAADEAPAPTQGGSRAGTESSAPAGSDQDASEGPVEPRYDEHGLLVRDGDTEQKVSVPALDDRDQFMNDRGTPDDDPGDHRGQPWATTTGTPPAGSDIDPETGAEEGEAVEGALGSRMDPTTETEIDGGDEHREVRSADQASAPPLPDQPASDESAPERQQSGRRISSFDEVADGGFGLGSAAPLADGAQPLGHAVKASRDGKTFLSPGDEGYADNEPDVWFYNEESARRAGFRKAGE